MELHKQYGKYIHSQPQMDGVADADPEVQSSVSTHMSCMSTTLIITMSFFHSTRLEINTIITPGSLI
jgi:hypothetical protein